MKLGNQLFSDKLKVPSSGTPLDHLFEELGFVHFVDAGFPFYSSIGALVKDDVEAILTAACEDAGFDRVIVPSVHNKDFVVGSEAFSNYPDTFLAQGSLVVAGTSEEYALELARKGLSSYKQLPMAFYVAGTSVRLIKRPKGMGVLREFSGVTMKTLDLDEESFKKSLGKFEGLTVEILNTLGIPFYTAEKKSGIEFFYTSSDGRELSLGMGYRANPDLVNRIGFNLADNSIGNPIMGTYGIGLERVLLAAVDQNLRDRNALLPPVLCPFEGVIIPVKSENPDHINAAEKVYKESEGFCLDDRTSLSVKGKLDFADYLGIEEKILIGDREVGEMS